MFLWMVNIFDLVFLPGTSEKETQFYRVLHYTIMVVPQSHQPKNLHYLTEVLREGTEIKCFFGQHDDQLSDGQYLKKAKHYGCSCSMDNNSSQMQSVINCRWEMRY